MDRLRNPFSPGAGTRPPELAGRRDILDQAILAIHRIRAGRSERSPMMVGLRGVGKTVLLVEIRRQAEAEGYQCLMVEAQEGDKLTRLLAPGLRRLLLRLDESEARGERVRRGMRVLHSFLSTVQVRIGETELQVEGPRGYRSATTPAPTRHFCYRD
jgi:Cdc6-like AAA superfamily ATPase